MQALGIKSTKNKKIKINYPQFVRSLILLVLLIGLIFYSITTIINFTIHPEKYITTLRYHLQNDIENGNENAIDYYSCRYEK